MAELGLMILRCQNKRHDDRQNTQHGANDNDHRYLDALGLRWRSDEGGRREQNVAIVLAEVNHIWLLFLAGLFAANVHDVIGNALLGPAQGRRYASTVATLAAAAHSLVAGAVGGALLTVQHVRR